MTSSQTRTAILTVTLITLLTFVAGCSGTNESIIMTDPTSHIWGGAAGDLNDAQDLLYAADKLQRQQDWEGALALYTDLADRYTGAHDDHFDAELCWELTRCAFHCGAVDLFHQWADRYIARLSRSQIATLPVERRFLVNLADSMRSLPPRVPTRGIDPSLGWLLKAEPVDTWQLPAAKTAMEVQ